MIETSNTSDRPYIGRFAPSPTGPLHMGSLICALASYLDAKARHGRWLLRIEDLDPPREQAGASEAILRTLQAFGLQWDGEVWYQSQRHEAYRQAIAQLPAEHLFKCQCSRKMLQTADSVYPGTCRSRSYDAVRDAPGIGQKTHYNLRVRVPAEQLNFNDRIQGVQHFDLQQEVGDFVIQRKDGLFAYQLAVVVDDFAQGITHVVRGSDLLDSTPRQIYLQQLLNLPTPVYAHHPVLTNAAGQKLSKQTLAVAITPDKPLATLRQALCFLNQAALPDSIQSVDAALQYAISHWQIKRIPARMQLPPSALHC